MRHRFAGLSFIVGHANLPLLLYCSLLLHFFPAGGGRSIFLALQLVYTLKTGVKAIALEEGRGFKGWAGFGQNKTGVTNDSVHEKCAGKAFGPAAWTPSLHIVAVHDYNNIVCDSCVLLSRENI